MPNVTVETEIFTSSLTYFTSTTQSFTLDFGLRGWCSMPLPEARSLKPVPYHASTSQYYKGAFLKRHGATKGAQITLWLPKNDGIP